MKILSIESFPPADLVTRIRQTRLRGFDGAQPYLAASINLVPAVDSEELCPAQNYVLNSSVAKMLELRKALLEHGVDCFALDGGAYVTTSDHPDEQIPVIPPIVEESAEPDGRTVLLINDGMHRVYAARLLGLPITVVVVAGVPAEYPYYAYALRSGWAGVTPFDELPDGHQRKEYRQPTGYRALFRDFNALFPGVQKERKHTNPAHLKM